MLPTGNTFDNVKKLRINHNKKRENMRQNKHEYKVGDKILVKHKENSNHEL